MFSAHENQTNRISSEIHNAVQVDAVRSGVAQQQVHVGLRTQAIDPLIEAEGVVPWVCHEVEDFRANYESDISWDNASIESLDWCASSVSEETGCLSDAELDALMEQHTQLLNDIANAELERLESMEQNAQILNDIVNGYPAVLPRIPTFSSNDGTQLSDLSENSLSDITDTQSEEILSEEEYATRMRQVDSVIEILTGRDSGSSVIGTNGLHSKLSFLVERGSEFDTLARALREAPGKVIGKVGYKSNGSLEGAIDLGGPLRELFTQAYNQALEQLTRPSQVKGATNDIDNTLDHKTIDNCSEQLADFGRLLAYAADQKKISLPSTFSQQAMDAMLNLANHAPLLNTTDHDSASELTATINKNFKSNKSLVSQVVKTLLPNIDKYFVEHHDNPLQQYAESSNGVSDNVKESLGEISDHLEQAIGLVYETESGNFFIPENNTRFVQLFLIATGFNSVREARIEQHGSIYPASIEALGAAIRSSGDIRRAFSDPSYPNYINVTGEDSVINKEQVNIFEKLIGEWAKQANDTQLSEVCRTITSSDVLPEIINSANRIDIQVRNIPILDHKTDNILGYAEFNPHTCFGSLEIAPHIVKEIVQQHQDNPDTLPARLDRLFAHDIPSENKQFNNG